MDSNFPLKICHKMVKNNLFWVIFFFEIDQNLMENSIFTLVLSKTQPKIPECIPACGATIMILELRQRFILDFTSLIRCSSDNTSRSSVRHKVYLTDAYQV